MATSYYRNTNSDWLYNKINKQKEPICRISKAELENNDFEYTELKDYKQIASYNWSTTSQKVMIIPGAPRIYANRTTKLQLNKSNYEQMVDENRYHQPDYPLESLFRAVKICEPAFDFNKVDFITDRNNLRKLFNFVNGDSDKSFRIDFEKIGNSIGFIRQEENAKENCSDYGKDFENKYTSLHPFNSVDGSHRRIVTYKFGDFNMLVRFEVDCVEQNESSQMNALSAAMAKVSLNTQQTKQFKDSELSYIPYGDFDKNEILMELSTKSIFNNKFDFPKHKWDQLFFSQTNFLVIGWHQRGLLKYINKYSFQDVTNECGRTKTTVKSSLNKLHNLLTKFKEIASDHSTSERQVFSIIFDPSLNSLSVYKCDGSHPGAIPKNLFNETIKN